MPRKKTLLCLIGIKLYEHLQEMKWQNIWDKLCIYARSFFFYHFNYKVFNLQFLFLDVSVFLWFTCSPFLTGVVICQDQTTASTKTPSVSNGKNLQKMYNGMWEQHWIPENFTIF